MAEDGIDVNIPVEPPKSDIVEVVIDKVATPVAAAPVTPVVPVLEQPQTKIIPAEEGPEILRAQIEKSRQDSERRLNEANRKIQEAFEAAQRAEQRATSAEQESVSVKKGAIATVLDSINRDKADARRELKAALEAGDFEKVADAQDRLALANVRFVEAEKGKQELEAAPVTKSNAVTKPAPVLANDDPVEQFASRLSSPSANWVRSNPQFVRDERLNRKMVRAHEDAVDDGHSVDSVGYFDFINKRLGLTKDEPVRAEPVREVSRAPASAPVSRDVPQSPSTSARPGVVHLSASEVSTARAMDMSLEDYARYKIQLQSEGKIGRVAS